MVSPREGIAFYSRLLQGLLKNLQPVVGPQDGQQQDSPLQRAAKDVLVSTCQLLGSESFLQQVLQSVQSLADPAAAVSTSQLEVWSYTAPCKALHDLQYTVHTYAACWKADTCTYALKGVTQLKQAPGELVILISCRSVATIAVATLVCSVA